MQFQNGMTAWTLIVDSQSVSVVSVIGSHLVPKCRRRAGILARQSGIWAFETSSLIDYERVIPPSWRDVDGLPNALIMYERSVNQTQIQTLMLKISVKEDEPHKRVLLQVEGRLVGPWVGELERCWETERTRVSSEVIVVRLANVSFIDDTGRELLSRISNAGSKLEGEGCMVRAIIARIIGAVFSARDSEGEKAIATQSGGGQGKRK